MATVRTRRVSGALVYWEDHRMRIVDVIGKDAIKVNEDFLSVGLVASDAIPGWTTTLVEAGGGESTVAQADESGGAVLITTDAFEDDGVSLQKLGEAFGLSSSQVLTYFGIRFKASEATQSDFLVGLCITDTALLGGMTDGVYFEKLDGGTGVSFVTEKDSTETQTDSLATFVADTYVILELYFDGTSVYAFIDGALVATHTANIPNNELLTPSVEFLTGAAAAETMTIDWIRAFQIGR